MPVLVYNTLTGELIIKQVHKESIGRFDQSEIDLDKTNNGEYQSLIGIAAESFKRWHESAQIAPDTALNTAQQAQYDAALKYYAAALIKKADIRQDCADCDCNKDEEYCYYLQQASAQLKLASIDIWNVSDFRLGVCGEQLISMYGAEGYSECTDSWTAWP